VMKIGTDNVVYLYNTTPTEVEITITNGSLYNYTVYAELVVSSGSASSQLLAGEELEDAVGLLQQGTAAASLVDLNADSAASDLAAGFDDALKSVAVESMLTAQSGPEAYYSIDTELDKFGKLNTASAGLLAS